MFVIIIVIIKYFSYFVDLEAAAHFIPQCLFCAAHFTPIQVCIDRSVYVCFIYVVLGLP